MISLIKQLSGSTSISLEVVQSGMSITVNPGTFTVDGVEYSLEDEQVFDAQERPEKTYVNAKLCQDEGGNVLVLVDENVGGFEEQFDWRESPYTELWPIFYCHIPPNTTSLNDVVISVYSVDIPQEPAEGEEMEEDNG